MIRRLNYQTTEEMKERIFKDIQCLLCDWFQRNSSVPEFSVFTILKFLKSLAQSRTNVFSVAPKILSLKT